ncbi:exosporium glycoprotein BclB-related protein [Algoriella sp.]|uniref:exosporium glycoprotein BclB-related protein n=1 Tax=Algoriella sp. TaxID=1872434 RepID=UPI002FC5B1E3
MENYLINFKTICIIVFYSFSTFIYAQVGIGTTDPKATLEVSKSLINENTSTDGIIAPKLTKIQLANKTAGTYGTNQIGSILYITDISGTISGPSLNQVTEINSIGYYYFSGTKWSSFNTNNSIGSSVIPLNSINASVATTILGGLIGTSTVLGPGVSKTGISLTGTTLNLLGDANGAAITLPRNCIIRSISFNHYTSAAISLIGSTLSLHLQIYKANAVSNAYEPILNTLVSNELTGLISLGHMASNSISNLNIPLAANDKIVVLISATATGLSLINTSTGFVSASIGLD